MSERCGPLVQIRALVYCEGCPEQIFPDRRSAADGIGVSCRLTGADVTSGNTPCSCPLRQKAVDEANAKDPGVRAFELVRKVDADARRVEHYLGRLQPASPLLAEIRAFLEEVG
jgi:hypothetical protein